MRGLVYAALAVVLTFGVLTGTASATQPASGLLAGTIGEFTGPGTQVHKVGFFSSIFRRTSRVPTKYNPGDIIINTSERRLYFVLKRGEALQYRVGVGRAGYEWSGVSYVARKAEWPGWTPPAAMRKREPHLPAYMPGGPNNPLGARALYLGASLYRIHGTRARNTIGRAVSSGCIRMLNDDVIDLYNRVRIGARVYVYR